MGNWFFVSVDLELTNICKNSCAVCPRDRIVRPQGMMSPEIFDQIITKLGCEERLITLSGMGDALLHPEVLKMIKVIKNSKADVGIVVNPASLSRSLIDGLVNSLPNVVNISFPSTEKEIFEKICPKISFDEALELTKYLIEVAKGRVGVTVLGISTKLNAEESDRFCEFWKSQGVRAEMFQCHGRGGNLSEKPALYTPRITKTRLKNCSLFNFHTFIAWNGDVLSCCHDLTGETRMGNIVEDGLETIVREKQEILDRLGMFDLCTKCDEPLRCVVLPSGEPPGNRKARRRFFKKMQRGTV